MRVVLVSVLLFVSLACAYMVTSPGDSQGWTTSGPNILEWQRVDTDPLNFTVVLSNMNSPNTQLLNTFVDGTLGQVQCNAPDGGWVVGSAFRVNLVQDPQHFDTILAQSNEFNITSGSSSGSPSGSTASGSTLTATSGSTTATSSASRVTSSDTSTTPTGTSAASLGADTRVGLLTAVAALSALVTTLF